MVSANVRIIPPQYLHGINDVTGTESCETLSTCGEHVGINSNCIDDVGNSRLTAEEASTMERIFVFSQPNCVADQRCHNSRTDRAYEKYTRLLYG